MTKAIPDCFQIMLNRIYSQRQDGDTLSKGSGTTGLDEKRRRWNAYPGDVALVRFGFGQADS